MPSMQIRDCSILNATLANLHLAETSPGEAHDADAKLPENDSDGRGDLGGTAEEAARELKISRSKERRRRGKDPLKEIMKGGKKTKGHPKSSRPNTGDTDGSGGGGGITSSPGSAISRAVELDIPQESYGGSTRSSSLSNERTELLHPARPVHADMESEPCDDSRLHPSTSVTSEFTHFQVDSQNMTNTPASSSSADSTSSASVLSPNTSPLQSSSSHDVVHINTSQSLPYISAPSYSSDFKRLSKHPNQTFGGSWDWDGHGQLSPNPSTNEINYRKPPRFRSKSRVPNSGAASPMPSSKSYTIPFTSPASYSPASSVSASSSPSIPSSESFLPSFTFPTLNSPSPSSSPVPNTHSNNNQHCFSLNSGANASTGHTPRRVQTPLRAPSRNSSPPLSLSSQTQIASLKGALEAARIREEKLRVDAERYSKECEVLKWKWGEETVAWRLREAELQSQVVHLMHQLQAYITAFTPTSPHLQVSSPNQPFPSHLHTPSPRQPPHLQMRSTAPPPRARSPFFPQSPPQPTPPNLLSLLFPTGSSSGSSSVESTSPQLDSAPLWDRGRGRKRTIRNGDADGDWVTAEGERGESQGEDDVSDILADAILKRPNSIRVRARERERREEFTFPSISSFGNAGRGGGGNKDEESILPGASISKRRGSSGEPNSVG